MGHDLGFTVLLLDIIIRRGVLKPAVLSNFVCTDDAMTKLAVENHIYSLAEIATERSLDVAQALIAKRKALVGKGVSMESDAEAGPKDYSGAVTHVMSMGGGPTTPNEKKPPSGDKGEDETDVTGDKRPRDEDEEEAEDGDEDSRRRRRKFDEEDQDTTAPASGEGDLVTAPAAELVLIDSTLAIALKDCRAIYSKLVTTLLVRLSRRYKELGGSASTTDENGDAALLLDAWSMSAISLVRTVLRAFHSAQDMLYLNGDIEHKVCDVESVRFEISDLELTPQLKAVWKAFSAASSDA